MVVADSGHVAIEHARPMTAMERRALGRAFSVDGLVLLASEEMDAERREVAQSFVALSGGDVQVRMNQAGRVLYRGRGSARVPREWCEWRGRDANRRHTVGERNLEAAPARRGGGRRQCGRARPIPAATHRPRLGTP